MINNIKESYEKMINEKKFFNNIENKIEQVKENINKLFTILSGKLNNRSKDLLDIYINNLKDELTSFYNERKESIYKNFDEKRTLQESMKKNIIEAYEQKRLNKKEMSMNKYIEKITDHLVTPIATNKENFFSILFFVCLERI